MKILRIMLILVSLLVVAVFAAASFLPTEINVTQTVLIKAPIQRVFRIVNSFEEYNQWSPWYELDPDAEYQTLGQQSGVGARYEWKSTRPELGRGSQQIISSQPFHLVQVEMQYGVQGNGLSRFDLDAVDEGTQVSWTYESALGGGFMTRYFGLALRKRVTEDCARGLVNLKRLAEASVEDSEGRSLEAMLRLF